MCFFESTHFFGGENVNFDLSMIEEQAHKQLESAGGA
jgi:hypothetical protein